MKKIRQAVCTLLLLAVMGTLELSARGYAQEPRLTVSLNDVPLSKVFDVIRQKTNYQFLYNDDILAGAPLVSVHARNAPVSEILSSCFKDAHLQYKIEDKTILVMAPPVAVPATAPVAQQAPAIEVRGVVRDEKGAPIEGASVVVKGSAKGVVSDAEGHFTINVQSEKDVLVFSYIGYVKEEKTVGASRMLLITLKLIDASMNDVVVVGYGVQKKVNVLGAVSVVKSDELVVTKNENVVNMLTGKVPGMRIQQMSSEPGSFNTSYDIRGFGSNATESPSPPLIIIDGVPRSSGDLSRMDPTEIDNISVLKDASAAIYGVKAANGVILVTTKRGAKNANGKFNITYSFNQSWQQFLDVPKTVNGAQYMTLYNESQKRNYQTNIVATAPPAFSDSLINAYATGKLQSTNWMAAITRKFAPEDQHNLNMSGGSEKVNYFFDLGYMSQGSLFKTNSINYDRWNFRSNVNLNFTKRLRGSVLVSGYMDTKNAPYSSVWTIFKYAENLLPTDPIYANNNPDYIHLEPDNANPVQMANSDQVGQNTYKNNNFQGQMQLEYDIPGIPGLLAKGMYNLGYSVSDNTIINKSHNMYTYDATNSAYDVTTVSAPSWVQRQYYTNLNTLMQLSLNYHRQFAGAHNVTALGLYEENYGKGDNFQAQESFSLGIPYLFAGNAGDYNYLKALQDGNGLVNQVTKSFIGRFDYDYKGRYLAEFSFREDGSSKYSPSGRWGFFPGALVGWRISQEPFLQQLISPSVLNNLKFRASYGKLGDDGALNYQWVSGYSYPGPGAVLNGVYTGGVVSQGIPDPGLTWMVSKTLNIGADFDLLNGLIGGTVEYFKRTRSGIPATPNAQLPGTSGLQPLQANLNGDVTRGFEITLTHRHNIGRDFSYNVSANMGYSRNRYAFQEQTRASSEYDQYLYSLTGRNTNIWWGQVAAGRFTSYSQIQKFNENTGGGNQNVVPGDYYYKDLNHDGVVDSKDIVPIGIRDLPLLNYGVTLGASYKGFDVSILLQGSADFHVQYAEQLSQPLMYQRSSLVEFMDRWHTKDPNANMFDPNTVWVPGNYPTTGSQEAQGTAAVQNASYLRVKTLEIGYSLSRKLLTRVGIQSLRIYVNSYNLATLTHLKYADPEHPGQTGDTNNGDTRITQDWNISQGGYLYPENRTFSVGASVSF